MTPIRKAVVGLLALALLLVFSLGAAGNAAAAQGAPSWSTGDEWVYTSTSGSTTSTLTMTVQEQTSLTIGATAYQVWHVLSAFSSTSGSTTITYTVNDWFTTNGIVHAKEIAQVPFLGNATTVWDPPQPEAVFPLAPGNSWSGSTQVTTTVGSISSTTPHAYSGMVSAEQTVSVPAGTFSTEVVRTPATGNPYTLSYYSDQVGDFVRIESYNSQGTLTSTQDLASYKYAGNTLLLIVIVVVVLGVLGIAAYVFLRRRRPPMPYQQVPGAQYPQPYAPPPPPGPPGPPR